MDSDPGGPGKRAKVYMDCTVCVYIRPHVMSGSLLRLLLSVFTAESWGAVEY